MIDPMMQQQQPQGMPQMGSIPDPSSLMLGEGQTKNPQEEMRIKFLYDLTNKYPEDPSLRDTYLRAYMMYSMPQGQNMPMFGQPQWQTPSQQQNPFMAAMTGAKSAGGNLAFNALNALQ